MSLCVPSRRLWITVLDTPSWSANARMDLLSSAMRASTSSESISSLYSLSTDDLNPGFRIQRATVDVGFLVFGIVATRCHPMFVVLHGLERPFLLARRQLVALLGEGVGDNHLAAREKKRQEAVRLRLEGVDLIALVAKLLFVA